MTDAETRDKRLRVLFIDDQAGVKSSAKDYADELYSIPNELVLTVLTTHEAAIEHIRGETRGGPPEDVVVLDIMFPDETVEGVSPMNIGYFLLNRHIRDSESSYKKKPVLILTNKDRDDVEAFIKGVENVWVREKSEVEPGDLLALLKMIVKKRS